MKKILMLIALLFVITCLKSYSQKRFGYTILYFRCGNDDAKRDRVYYSPIVELNALNFPQYTDGIDPAIAKYSVRYYNYAISKWFEIYLREKYKILINTLGKYARKSNSVVYNENNKAACNDDKTNPECFFLSKQELTAMRNNAIMKSRSAEYSSNICEVVDL